MYHSPLLTIHPAPNRRYQEVDKGEKYVWLLYCVITSITIKCPNMPMSLFSRNSIPKPKTCRTTLIECLKRSLSSLLPLNTYTSWTRHYHVFIRFVTELKCKPRLFDSMFHTCTLSSTNRVHSIFRYYLLIDLLHSYYIIHTKMRRSYQYANEEMKLFT